MLLPSTKFTGIHLCQGLFLNKIAVVLRPPTLFKKRLVHRSFPVDFVKFLRTPLVAAYEIIKPVVSLDDYFVVQLLFAIVIECGKLYLDCE